MMQAARADGARGRVPNPQSNVMDVIVEALSAFEPEGLTTAEVVMLTGRRRTSISARISELEGIGFIVPTGRADPIPRGGLPARKYRLGVTGNAGTGSAS